MKDILIKQIPNIFTVLRIVFVILAFFLLLNGFYIISLILIIIASITDYFDGYFARALNAQSAFGAKLDQVADKLFEILICLGLIIENNYFIIGTLFLELLLSILIIFKFLKIKRWSTSIKIGKIKTSLIFTTIILGMIYLLVDSFYYPFLIVWIITTFVQIYANYIIYKEYKPNSKGIEELKKISKN